MNDHFLAAVFSARLNRWETVWLRAETTVDEGSFVLTDGHRDIDGASLPVAEYRPERNATHTPLGPLALEAAGLREVPKGTEPHEH